jgi:hypothetical protein
MLKRIQVMTTRMWPLSFDIDEEVGPHVDDHEASGDTKDCRTGLSKGRHGLIFAVGLFWVV